MKIFAACDHVVKLTLNFKSDRSFNLDLQKLVMYQRKSASHISWAIAEDNWIKWSLKIPSQLLGSVHFSHCNLCIQSKQVDVPPKQTSAQPIYHPRCHPLVQVTIISCLDIYNNPMTRFLLPILSFSHPIYMKQPE